ncbi:Transcriptional regulator [gamma proteobacterium HdN1]|nr:Transcriptional regulator [gamma proteobacterium HdN1]
MISTGCTVLEGKPMSDLIETELPNTWLGRPTTEVRTRILCAAQIIFARDGFSGAEQVAIATLAKVGKSTLYKVANGKQALFLTVVSENLEYMRSLVFARLIGTEPPLERIQLAARDVLTQMQKNRGLLRVMVVEAGNFGGEIQRRYLSTIDASMPVIESLFNLVREETTLHNTPARDVINMIVNMMIGTAYSWALTGEGDLVEEGMHYMQILEGLFQRR